MVFSVCQAYGHPDRVFDVQFHPHDPDVLASASEDCTVRVWKKANGADQKFKQVLCCYGHEAEVMRLGWSLDGTYLASGSADNTVRVWQVPDQSSGSTLYQAEEVAVLRGHPEEVYHCEFVLPGQPTQPHTQPTGTAAHDTVATALGHEPAAPDSAGHGPGSHILAASSESLFLWDLEQGVLTQQADAPGTSGSTVPPDAVVTGYQHAYIFAMARQPLRQGKGQQGGQLLACACNDGLIRLWTLMKGGLQYVGHRAISSGGPGKRCAPLTAVTWDTAGTRLAVAAKDGRVHILDSRKQLQVVHTVHVHSSVLTCCTLPAGSPVSSGWQSNSHGSSSPSELLLLGCSDGVVRAMTWESDASGADQLVDLFLHGSQPGQTSQVLALGVTTCGSTVAVAGAPAEQAVPASNSINSTKATHHHHQHDSSQLTEQAAAPADPVLTMQALSLSKAAHNHGASTGDSGVAQQSQVMAAPARRRRGTRSGRTSASGGAAAQPGVTLDDVLAGDDGADPSAPREPEASVSRQEQADLELGGSGSGGDAHAVVSDVSAAAIPAHGHAGHKKGLQVQDPQVRAPIYVLCSRQVT